MPCSAVKVKRCVREHTRLRLPVSVKQETSMKQALFLSKRRLTFTELTCSYIPEDRTLSCNRCDNLKSDVAISLLHEIYLNNFIQIQSVRHSAHAVSLRNMEFKVVTLV